MMGTRRIGLYRPIISSCPFLTRLYSSTSGRGGALFTEQELQALRSKTKNVAGTQLHLPLATTPHGQPKQRAVVVLVGWVASTLRVLAKYAPVYTELGIPCLCVCPSPFQLWVTQMGDSLTHNALKSLETSLDSNPASLILHLCSGGAGVLLPKLSVETRAKPGSSSSPLLSISCAIFDSGPVEFAYDTGTAAAKLIYKQGQYSFPAYMAANAVGITTEKLFGTKKRRELEEAMESDLMKIPQLYLYSEADTVMLASRVRERIETQAAMGRSVSSYCWTDSQHVRHLLEHPNEYREQVVGFLKKCKII